MAAADRLTIERVATTYVVPRGHPAPDALRRRGEEALRDHLSSALAEHLRRIVPANDPSVWIIRELDVDFPFAAESIDIPALAVTWGQEIVQRLTRTIRAGEGVTRFPNRAAYLAQYIADVAAGRDSGCWYYAQFNSLRALPSSANIREALVREPDLAGDVLITLARSLRLEAVLGVLTEQSARAIYDAAFPHGEAPLTLSPHMIEVLLAFADALLERGGDGSIATSKNAIRLMTAMLNGVDTADDADVRSHVDTLLGFASLLATTREPWRLVEAIVDRDTQTAVGAGAVPFVDLATIDRFIRLAAIRPDLVTCAAGTLAPNGEARVAYAGEAVPTARAGLALLLDSLADTNVFNGDSSEDAEMRVRVAIKCAGAERAIETLGDPVMKLFTGFGAGGRDITALTADRQDLVSAVAHDVMRRFAARLFGFAGSSFEYLYTNFLAGRGTLRFDDEKITVDLPPVPLEVVLRLAGMHEKQIVVPWLPDRTITLRLGASA